jgi:hypothetical protein
MNSIIMVALLVILLMPRMASAGYLGSQYNEPDDLVFSGYTIGQEVDTNVYVKSYDLYFPNYLDGFNLSNFERLPKDLSDLPIAIWQWKVDSNVTPNLIGNKVMKVIISGYTDQQKDSLITALTRVFNGEPEHKKYDQTHPLQPYVTAREHYTWDTDNVIVQIGSGYLKHTKEPYKTVRTWNLIYSDFRKEKQMIAEFRQAK